MYFYRFIHGCANFEGFLRSMITIDSCTFGRRVEVFFYSQVTCSVAVVVMSITSELNQEVMITFSANIWNDVHRVKKDHFLVEQRCQDYFLTVLVLARFSLSIKRRSEAEHLERTTPISASFLRSIAASAAPSRSLGKIRRGCHQRGEASAD